MKLCAIKIYTDNIKILNETFLPICFSTKTMLILVIIEYILSILKNQHFRTYLINNLRLKKNSWGSVF